MPPCTANTKKGDPCSHQARTGFTTCGKHKAHGAATCSAFKTNGEPCMRVATDTGHCLLHNTVLVRALRARLYRETEILVEDLLWTWGDLDAARDVIDNAPGLSWEAQIQLHIHLNDELGHYMELHPPPAVPLKGELHALSLDNQSVHTGPVNRQTLTGLDLLLETSVPLTEVSTVVEIANLWATQRPKVLMAVVKDMRNWYKTKTCRDRGDNLYRRVLDGLWTRIKLSPMKDELLQRLWEECRESVDTCCEGHISRLCNVMCGFDDAFKAPLSVADRLQMEMASIAAKEIHVHLKVGEAWAVFEELSIPMGERMAWIEAF